MRDGSTVTIRPLELGDEDLIRQIWDAMSELSRRRRFLCPANEVSDEDMRYLVDVDHRRHEALIALDEAGRPLGVARYVRTPGDPTSAEVAVVVGDAWHRRGHRHRAARPAQRAGARERHRALHGDRLGGQRHRAAPRSNAPGAERTGETGEGEIEFASSCRPRASASGPAATLRAASEAQHEFVAAVWRRLAIWRRLG